MNNQNPFADMYTISEISSLILKEIYGLELSAKTILQPKENIYVGMKNYEDNTYVKIWVSSYPANVWKFEIKTIDGILYKFKGSSGSLEKFVHLVENVREGTFGMEKLSLPSCHDFTLKKCPYDNIIYCFNPNCNNYSKFEHENCGYYE